MVMLTEGKHPRALEWTQSVSRLGDAASNFCAAVQSSQKSLDSALLSVIIDNRLYIAKITAGPGELLPVLEVRMPVLNTTQLYQQVYDHLRAEITRGVYHPGQRLVVEQLASELGVSQTPVRAALTRLQSDGLVAIFPRKGTFVTTTTPKEVREVFQLRRIIECASLESCQALSEELLCEFDQVVAESAALIDGQKFLDYTRYLQLDVEFHHLIVGLLQNQRASAFYQTLRWPVQLMLALVGSDNQRSSATVDEHREIVVYLRAADAMRAKEALLRHLANSELDLLSRLASGKAFTEAPGS